MEIPTGSSLLEPLRRERLWTHHWGIEGDLSLFFHILFPERVPKTEVCDLGALKGLLATCLTLRMLPAIRYTGAFGPYTIFSKFKLELQIGSRQQHLRCELTRQLAHRLEAALWLLCESNVTGLMFVSQPRTNKAYNYKSRVLFSADDTG